MRTLRSSSSEPEIAIRRSRFSLSGNASELPQRDPSHRWRIRRLVTDLVKGRRDLDDAVREPSEPGDLYFDHVAGIHRARIRGRSRQHDIAGQERDVAGEVR